MAWNARLNKVFTNFYEYCATCRWLFRSEDDWLRHKKDGDPTKKHRRAIELLRLHSPRSSVPLSNLVSTFCCLLGLFLIYLLPPCHVLINVFFLCLMHSTVLDEAANMIPAPIFTRNAPPPQPNAQNAH